MFFGQFPIKFSNMFRVCFAFLWGRLAPPHFLELQVAGPVSAVFEFLTRFVTFQVVPPLLLVCFPAHIRQNLQSAAAARAQTII